ncbi:MAG: hypothetical protein B6226_04715 [Candidatus Cloacimonetes bacterium 4572_65]|nr:MAG: hypothetical protein B6226_04715 [Candidatus Cloacimonetes bacterium 4572_65]
MEKIAKEFQLYSIWQHQLLNHALVGCSGEEIRVHYPGNFNRDSGADFKNALLVIDGVKVSGDIEIHIRKRDWIHHKHHLDKNYDKVILHVIWIDDNSSILTSSGATIPTLIMANFVTETAFDTDNFIGYNCDFFGALGKYQINYLLQELGMKRVLTKSKRYKELSYIESSDVSIINSIAVALGYPNNKDGMHLLASRITKRKLETINYEELDDYISELLDEIGLGSVRNSNSNLWHLFRIRPNGQPAVRVRSFILLCWYYREVDISLKLWDIFVQSDNLKEFSFKVNHLLNPYEASFDKHLFGDYIIGIITFNIIFPFILSKIEMETDKINLAKILAFLKLFKMVGDNRITKTFTNKISDYQYKHITKIELNSQGLHFLMKRYCINHECKLCKLERDMLLKTRETDEKQ